MPEIQTEKTEGLTKAMALEFIQKPQDGRADTVLNFNMAPSFIMYNARTLERVMDFFKSKQVRIVVSLTHPKTAMTPKECSQDLIVCTVP